MTTIRWTEQAVADLKAIHEYVGRDSDHYASLLVERLLSAVTPLARFPELAVSSRSTIAQTSAS